MLTNLVCAICHLPGGNLHHHAGGGSHPMHSHCFFQRVPVQVYVPCPICSQTLLFPQSESNVLYIEFATALLDLQNRQHIFPTALTAQQIWVLFLAAGARFYEEADDTSSESNDLGGSN
jgi:hypothetical protein